MIDGSVAYRLVPRAGEERRLLEFVFGPRDLLDDQQWRPSEEPASLRLSNAYPNPFRGATVVGDTIPASGHVRLAVYDARGRLVRRLWDGPAEAGDHLLSWDGRGAGGGRMPSGVYVLRLEHARRMLTGRLIRLR